MRSRQSNVRDGPTRQWDVMRPLNQVHAVAPNTPVSEALEVMAREDLNQLAVIRDGQLSGVISRANVLQLLRTRAELQV